MSHRRSLVILPAMPPPSMQSGAEPAPVPGLPSLKSHTRPLVILPTKPQPAVKSDPTSTHRKVEGLTGKPHKKMSDRFVNVPHVAGRIGGRPGYQRWAFNVPDPVIHPCTRYTKAERKAKRDRKASKRPQPALGSQTFVKSKPKTDNTFMKKIEKTKVAKSKQKHEDTPEEVREKALKILGMSEKTAKIMAEGLRLNAGFKSEPDIKTKPGDETMGGIEEQLGGFRAPQSTYSASVSSQARRKQGSTWAGLRPFRMNKFMVKPNVSTKE